MKHATIHGAVCATLVAVAVSACGGDDDSPAIPSTARAITSAPDNGKVAAFDIVRTEIVTDKGFAIFRTKVREGAGTVKPAAIGTFGGSEVYSYV